MGAAASRQGRADTFPAACEIHGAKEDVRPAVGGLVDTIAKNGPESHLVDPNKLKRAFSKVYKK